MTLYPECHFCGVEMRDRRFYRLVQGWEETRPQGGANKITMRTASGPVAHRSCVEEAKHRNIAAGQLTFLGGNE